MEFIFPFFGCGSTHMKDKREEIRRRLPRLVTNFIMAIIFWVISMFIPPTLPNIVIPGIGTEVSFLVWIFTIAITAIFLIRALTDALALGDVLTDAITKKLGVKEEQASKRAAREIVYIIAIVLIVTAASPLLLNIQDVGYYLSTATVYIGLGLIILFIYDIGRTVYKIIEEKAESLANYVSQPKQDKSSD
jgi:SNF family Na+-dependent transporter